MTSEMVERIARALHKTYDPHEDIAWERLPPSAQDQLRADATTILKAMREPTTGMIGAAQTAWLHDPARRTSTLYRAMIDHEIKLAEGGGDEQVQ